MIKKVIHALYKEFYFLIKENVDTFDISISCCLVRGVLLKEKKYFPAPSTPLPSFQGPLLHFQAKPDATTPTVTTVTTFPKRLKAECVAQPPGFPVASRNCKATVNTKYKTAPRTQHPPRVRLSVTHRQPAVVITRPR